MDALQRARRSPTPALTAGIVATVALLALSAATVQFDPAPKLLGISWVAFAAMAGLGALGARATTTSPRGLVWGYGLAAGAMVTSAAVFLVPPAVSHHAALGGFGIAAGLLAGFAGHTVGHRLTHLDLPFDRTVAELTAHTLTAGSIIGVVYATLPSLGPLLGLAIVSHKGPAGYAAARRLTGQGRPVAGLLVPASGVGIAALAVSLFAPEIGAETRGAVFGFGAGIFLHVAMDFLPRCETGSEVHDAVTEHGTTEGGRAYDEATAVHAHERLDRLRLHAVGSTVLGGLAVLAAWLVVG